MNFAPSAATDEPADSPSPDAATVAVRPACRVSDRLSDALIDSVLDAGADCRGGRATRKDGWTPEKVRIFIETLAECGVVEDAARAAGMTKWSAYALRRRTANRAFHLAWEAAERQGGHRLAGEAMSRALHGFVEVTVRDGIVTERHRFDNRLTMAVLARLDRLALAGDPVNRAVRLVGQELDPFLDIVCAGGDDAGQFIIDRIGEEDEGADEHATLARCENYAHYGVGLACEIDISDLDPAKRAEWTEEQYDRANRSGLISRLARKAAEEAARRAEEEEGDEGDDDEEMDWDDEDEEMDWDDEDEPVLAQPVQGAGGEPAPAQAGEGAGENPLFVHHSDRVSPD